MSVRSLYRFTGDTLRRVEKSIAEELPLTISINGQELTSILCTPDNKLNFLVLGFLYLEGIIKGLQDVMTLHVENGVAEVRLTGNPELPKKKVRTSGCGRGITFQLGVDIPPVNSKLEITPHQVSHLMKLLYSGADSCRSSGGIHSSALSDGEQLLVIAEDLGRHNTLDKIQGECLFREIRTEGRILLTTGRVSSEMLLKAAKMRIPILISRTSTTELAVELADQLGITFIGYARGKSFYVYSGLSRVTPIPDGTQG